MNAERRAIASPKKLAGTHRFKVRDKFMLHPHRRLIAHIGFWSET